MFFRIAVFPNMRWFHGTGNSSMPPSEDDQQAASHPRAEARRGERLRRGPHLASFEGRADTSPHFPEPSHECGAALDGAWRGCGGLLPTGGDLPGRPRG